MIRRFTAPFSAAPFFTVSVFTLLIALATWGQPGIAATLDVAEADFGDYPNAVAANNPIAGSVDAGANLVSGRLSGQCIAAFGGGFDCNRGFGDGQDSFALSIPDHLFVHGATLTWTGTAPQGFRAVLNLRDLATGMSRLIGAPLGRASLSDVVVQGGPVHLSVLAGSATAPGDYDVAWAVTTAAAVPLPAGLSFGLTGLAALAGLSLARRRRAG